MKPITWIFLILAVAMTAVAVIFIMKYKKTNARLTDANAALVVLGQPEFKTPPATGSSTATGTNPASTGSLAQG